MESRLAAGKRRRLLRPHRQWIQSTYDTIPLHWERPKKRNAAANQVPTKLRNMERLPGGGWTWLETMENSVKPS